MTEFLRMTHRHTSFILMALGFSLIPSVYGASDSEIPDYAARGDFSEEQQAGIQLKRDELVAINSNIDLARAKVAAIQAKIAGQKDLIATLTARIEGKNPELASLAGGGSGDTDSKGRLPAGFIAEVTPRIVIIEGDKGNGTGFLCRSGDEVWVYTAAHVLSGNRTITVRDNTGRAYRDFEFLECAEGVDLVRLKPKDTGLEGLDLVLPDLAPKVGDVIVAIGNSLGAGSLTGEPGTIRSIQDDMWEVDAEIIPGNSGGPVISYKSGRVVGIVTHLTIALDKENSTPLGIDKKPEVKRFAARLDKDWKWRRIPVSRFVKEWEHIENMNRTSSIAWASIYMMHTGPSANPGSSSRTDPEQVRLAQAILARDRNHMQVQRVDDWLKRYRAAGSVRQGELIKEGNAIIARNLDEIRFKENGPKASDFSWFHRQSYEAEVAFRNRLIKSNP
jgi:serine protease Do